MTFIQSIKELTYFDLFFHREWVCEPAWRSISEREAASSFQKEKNDRIGFGGRAPLRDLQNITGAHQHLRLRHQDLRSDAVFGVN